MFTVRHISQHEGYCGENPPRPLIASSFLVTCLLFIFSEAAFHSGYCFRCPGFNCLSPVTRASCLMAFAHAWRLGIWRWMIYINDGRWWKRLGNDMGKENDIRQLRSICQRKFVWITHLFWGRRGFWHFEHLGWSVSLYRVFWFQRCGIIRSIIGWVLHVAYVVCVAVPFMKTHLHS